LGSTSSGSGRWERSDRRRAALSPIRSRAVAYAATLSVASTRSLASQGGPIAGAALERFRRLPHAAAAIAVRRWDDRAKVAGLPVPPVSAFHAALRRALRRPT
jgi:predicted HD phosphohydrolase